MQKPQTTGPDPENHADVDTEHVAKRKSVTLTAGGEALTFMALRRRDDRGTVFAIQTSGTGKAKKTQRGMTKEFDDFEKAIAALDELVKDAMKKGWFRKERSGGFKARPDAFSTVPTPSSSPAKGKK